MNPYRNLLPVVLLLAPVALLAQREYPRPDVAPTGGMFKPGGYFGVAQAYSRAPRDRAQVAYLVLRTWLSGNELLSAVGVTDSAGNEWRPDGSSLVIEVLPGTYQVTVRHSRLGTTVGNLSRQWIATPGQTFAVFLNEITTWQGTPSNPLGRGEESRTFLPPWDSTPTASRKVDVRVVRAVDASSSGERRLQIAASAWLSLMRDYDDKHRADEMLGPRAACEAVSGGLRCTYSDVVYRTELEGSAARDSQPGRPLILVFDGDSFLIRIEEYR